MPVTIGPNIRVRSKLTTAFPAADTAAVVTLAATPDKRHCVFQVDVSFILASPTNGTLLTISGLNDDGAATYTSAAIPTGGVGVVSFVFPEALIGSRGGAVTITLAAGGGTSVGKLNVIHAA